MSTTPNRPRGRPRLDNALTVAERQRRHRETVGPVGSVHLQKVVLEGLDVLAKQYGDPSREAVVARLVRERLFA